MVGDLRGLGPQVRLAEYHDFDPSLVYYSRRIVAKLDRTADLANVLAQPGDAIVIMDSARFAALPEPVRGLLRQTAGRGKKLAFAKVTPVSAQR